MTRKRRRSEGLQPGYTLEDLERVRRAHKGENGVTAEELDEEALERVYAELRASDTTAQEAEESSAAVSGAAG